MIRNFCFDMGKTVLDYTSWGVVRHYIKDPAMQRKIVNAVFYSTEWMVQDAGFATPEESLAKVKTHLDTDKERHLADLCWRDWPKYNLWPMAGMDGVTHALKKAGFGVYMISNASIVMPRYIRGLLPNPDDYDGFIFSAEVHYLKPQREMFEKAFERFGIRPEESFFIDDLPGNIAGSKAAGMDGYVFDGDVEKLKKEIEEKAGVSIYPELFTEVGFCQTNS
ncbi:MAG: HAD family hydrolase [Eubacterium sp.]